MSIWSEKGAIRDFLPLPSPFPFSQGVTSNIILSFPLLPATLHTVVRLLCPVIWVIDLV